MRKFSNSTRAKIMAIAAAGLIVGVGGTVTLAAWVDTEWVYGGTGGDEPGVGTSEFVVQQNTSSPFADGTEDANWLEEPANPGGSLTFTGAPLALTPGDVIYAPVALRTTVDSISGNVDLQGAIPADGVTVDDTGDLLWDALELRVGVVEVDDEGAAPTCNAAFFDDADFIVITGGLGDAAAIDIPIDSAGSSYLHWCFEIALPTVEELEDDDIDPTTLQGRTVAPAWEFVSTSVSV